MRPPALLLAGLAVAALAAGCGDDDEAEPAGTGTSEAPAMTEPEAAPPTEPAVSPTKDLDRKPRIPAQRGGPPTELVTQDIVEGRGRAARAGDTVRVQYVGVRFRDGRQFDASWDRGREPFPFPLGAGRVIPGWDQGVAGMRVGGRRQLTIPPDLAYGDTGAPPDIAPGETLIFVVDLEGIEGG